MTTRSIRCAIYTRKSTEEGLDQAFNSLDAQREACQAYIKSQVSQGWSAVHGAYDDGGYSGGNMERPALQKLLADIEHGLIDIVVVYKIDRLTRSLSDFAKIVDRFEKRNVSFVSVTQAFNTTTPMGRLTLNVLLSFAQFEREVTAERIRDKFAASRKKGIFMGGNPPLGYDAKDRKLVINETQAAIVRFIFQRYLELGSVSNLLLELEAKGIRTKAWVSTRGKAMGGGRWYTGPLRHILRNRVYIGDAMHKGVAHVGEHRPILACELFEAVQDKLDANRASHHRSRTIGTEALLTGIIFDDRGNVMSPSKSRKSDGRSDLYYVSQGRLQRRDPDAMRPVPAAAIEEIVRDRMACLTAIANGGPQPEGSSEEPNLELAFRELVRKLISRVEIAVSQVVILINTNGLARHADVPAKSIPKKMRTLLPTEDTLDTDGEFLRLVIPVRLRLRGGIKRVEGWEQSDWVTAKARHDPGLIRALSQAHEWRKLIEKGEVITLEDLAARTGHHRSYVRTTLKLAFLAPDIQRAILTGRQPKSLTLSQLAENDIPLLWQEQRTMLSCAQG